MTMLAPLRDRTVQTLFLVSLFLIFLGLSSGAVELRGLAGGLPLPVAGSGLGLLRTNPAFLLLLLLGIGLCLSLPRLDPVPASLLTLASIAPVLLVEYLAPPGPGLLPLEYSLLSILLLYALNVLMGYFRETHARQNIISIFGQYIPPQLVQEINRDPDQFDLSGEAREMTVFFSDLQDFTGVAEQLNPKQLALLLNEFFTAMTEVLYRHSATIDKYIGDSIMAFWGAPVRQPDHALRSVLSAFDMQRELAELSASFSDRGWPGLNMGVGINTGVMNVGNMGSKYRIAYTVVGDAVNLAARLEALTRIYRVPCIVSESTRRGAAGVLFRELDEVQVKGKTRTTTIYQPICLREAAGARTLELLERHAEGMTLQHRGRRQEAAAVFRGLARDWPGDGLYPVLLHRLGGQSPG